MDRHWIGKENFDGNFTVNFMKWNFFQMKIFVFTWRIFGECPWILILFWNYLIFFGDFRRIFQRFSENFPHKFLKLMKGSIFKGLSFFLDGIFKKDPKKDPINPYKFSNFFFYGKSFNFCSFKDSEKNCRKIRITKIIRQNREEEKDVFIFTNILWYFSFT